MKSDNEGRPDGQAEAEVRPAPEANESSQPEASSPDASAPAPKNDKPEAQELDAVCACEKQATRIVHIALEGGLKVGIALCADCPVPETVMGLAKRRGHIPKKGPIVHRNDPHRGKPHIAVVLAHTGWTPNKVVTEEQYDEAVRGAYSIPVGENLAPTEKSQ